MTRGGTGWPFVVFGRLSGNTSTIAAKVPAPVTRAPADSPVRPVPWAADGDGAEVEVPAP
jgi:hypothetical protein